MTLDEFVDNCVAVSIEHGYHPTRFLEMRQSGAYPLVGLIKHLVETSEPRSGFVRMKQLGLADWTLEAAVVKFPDEFTTDTLAYAKARLAGTLDA